MFIGENKMDYLSLNTQSIKEHHMFLYKKLKRKKDLVIKKKLDDIFTLETKNQERALFIKYKSNEIRLNSKYNSTYEASRWIKQYNFRNLNTIVIMFGLGNGVFAKAILNQMKLGDQLLIYEPSYELFEYVLEHYDVSEILTNSQVSIGVESISTFEFHKNLLAFLDVTNMNSSIICMHPFYDRIFKNELVNFWKEVRQAFIHARTNINTIIRFGEKEIENSITNLKYLKNSSTIWELKNYIPKDATAIIVSAGPSVTNQIDDLKKAKGKAIIFAVDRVLDYLLDSGVVPDFVVTVDPMKETKYFTHRDNVTIPLLCFSDSNSEILNKHKGKKIISNCGEFLLRAYTKLTKFPPVTLLSPSVATVTFSNCLDLGFKHIVLVGQDLSYSDTYTHVGGVEEKNIYQMDVYIKGIDGNQIRSRSDWKSFVIWFQDMIILNPDVNVIDAKLSGAKIEGTTNLLLHDVVSCLKNDIWNDDVIEKLDKTFNEEEFELFKDYLVDSKDALENIYEKAECGITLCKKVIECLNNDIPYENSKHIQIELKEINNYIVAQPIYFLMDYIIKGKIVDQMVTIKQLSGNSDDDDMATYMKSIKIYEAIIDSVEFIRPLLENSIKELN